MSTGVIIAIVVIALILLALFVFIGRKGRQRKLETRRHEAREIGREAEVDRAEADRTRAEADRTRAEADAQAAEARRQEALARERGAEAEEKHRQARDRHIEAASRHPDMDEKEAAEEFDRRHAEQREGGATPAGSTGVAGAGNGEGAVRHHERTETPAEERERHFERNEQGEVVRDEEYQEPRR
jgi:F0F1-type ATP synthase membrane subunit b/b'